MMSPALVESFWQALGETVLMVAGSGVTGSLLGLPLGVLLATTGKNEVFQAVALHRILGGLTNVVRSIPFIILLVAAIPLTRWIVGTSIGTAAAIVPLSLAAIPFFARLAEASLREVDAGLIEAAQSMGASRWQIVWEILLREARPGLVSGFTVTLVNLIGASAMAGLVGGGGLGDLAIRYGLQRFDPLVMTLIVAVLVVMVTLIQWAGDSASRHLDKRA